MMRKEIVEAVDLLHTVRVGDAVQVCIDGKYYDMNVSREASRSDGMYGSFESTHITVTFGPGRYSTEIRAEKLADGSQSLIKVPS